MNTDGFAVALKKDKDITKFVKIGTEIGHLKDVYPCHKILSFHAILPSAWAVTLLNRQTQQIEMDNHISGFTFDKKLQRNVLEPFNDTVTCIPVTQLKKKRDSGGQLEATIYTKCLRNICWKRRMFFSSPSEMSLPIGFNLDLMEESGLANPLHKLYDPECWIQFSSSDIDELHDKELYSSKRTSDEEFDVDTFNISKRFKKL